MACHQAGALVRVHVYDCSTAWLCRSGVASKRRHLWQAAVKAGGLGNIDTQLFEAAHKLMAHAPYQLTSKQAVGLARRMTRHIRRGELLRAASLRRTPSGSASIETRPESGACATATEVRFAQRGGLVIHEGGMGFNCGRRWIRRGKDKPPKCCKCGAREVRCACCRYMLIAMPSWLVVDFAWLAGWLDFDCDA